MSRCRLLELIPDLRTRVYKEVLTHDRTNGQIATVALLRTCRRIHREAEEVLYASSTLSLFAMSYSSWEASEPGQPDGVSRSVKREVIVNGDITAYVDTASSSIENMFGSYSFRLSSPAKVVLELRIGNDGDELFNANMTCPQIPELLRTITRWLNRDGKPRRLHFMLASKQLYPACVKRAKEDFSPLAELHPRNELSFRGLGQRAVQHLYKIRKEIQPPSATYKSAEALTSAERLAFERLLFSNPDLILAQWQ